LWGVWHASTKKSGREEQGGMSFAFYAAFWYVHCEFIEGDFIAQTNVAFYKCFKCFGCCQHFAKDGAY